MAEEYYNLGNSNLAAGKVERALALFELAIRADPSLLQAHYNLSLALLRAGRGEQAMRNLEELAARDPDNLMIVSLQGYAAYRLGRFDEALARYEGVLTRAPGDREALYNKGLVLEKLGRTAEAGQAFASVADRSPGDELALEALLRIARVQREAKAWDRVAAALERYAEWKPESAAALLDLAAAYRAQEKYLPAIEIYRRAAALAPENTEAWASQAELLLTVIEDPEGGLQALERALRGGFADRARLSALVADERLLERERVRALLLRWGVLEEAAAKDAAAVPATSAKP